MSARCDACGTTGPVVEVNEFGGWLCAQCSYRQEEHDQYGHGLSASTFGFLGEDE